MKCFKHSPLITTQISQINLNKRYPQQTAKHGCFSFSQSVKFFYMFFEFSELQKPEYWMNTGYWLTTFLIFGESIPVIGWIVPGSFLLLFLGFLTSIGILEFQNVFIFALVGAIFGDAVGFHLSQIFGIKLLKKLEKGLVHDATIFAESFFKKHGNKSVFFGRFIGLIRPTIPLLAGVFQMKTSIFYFWNILGGVLWVGGYLLLGYLFGETWDSVFYWSKKIGFSISGIAIIIAAVSCIWHKISKKYHNKRGVLSSSEKNQS